MAVRVQEFLPDRLKISARLSKESLEGWVSPDGLKARVQLLNLFGTPAENRRVKASLMLSPTLPSFSKFREYQFFDPMQAKEALSENLEEGETNEKGESEFELPLSRFASATYRPVSYTHLDVYKRQTTQPSTEAQGELRPMGNHCALRFIAAHRASLDLA